MGRITKLQNTIGELQMTLAEKNKLIRGFKAEVEQLTKTCDDATKALNEAKGTIVAAEQAVRAALQ